MSDQNKQALNKIKQIMADFKTKASKLRQKDTTQKQQAQSQEDKQEMDEIRKKIENI